MHCTKRHRGWLERLVGACALALLVVASGGCGDKYGLTNMDATSSADASGLDGSVTPDGQVGLCGDGIVEGSEQCDDANQSADDECLPDCTWACGDGVVNAVELCDTGIAAGQPGACPTDCDDTDACTTDTVAGSECQTECVHGAITACAHGDGCCPTGCDQGSDSDCAATCGNSIIETGETCDPPGSCPTSCDDSNLCTTDTMAGSAATCDVVCTNAPITACAGGDGCCPSGCNTTNDTDCSASCGNGVVESGETCDPQATCPTTCDDTDVCTTDTMTGSVANCNVTCTNTPISACTGGDGCCPGGCHANNDTDCSPVCGNHVVEPGEGCDDGNLTDGDGCDSFCQPESGPTVFRLSDLDLRDPHIFVPITSWWCSDYTDQGIGFTVNGALQDAVTGDSEPDGELDLSFIIIMRPLTQSVPGGNPADVAEASCTAPMAGTTCTTTVAQLQPTNYVNGGTGDCLDVLPGTTDGYNPPITTPGPVCFSTDPFTFTLDFSGITIPLTDVRVGATYVGNPAGQLTDGLLRGFIAESIADVTILPNSLPVIGGLPLSSVLPGGTGSCEPGTLDVNNGVPGWWFYLNFPADEVIYTGP